MTTATSTLTIDQAYNTGEAATYVIGQAARLPYRVSYRWANGVAGSTARHSLDEAELLADRIEASAYARDLPVTITIAYVATPGSKGTAIATRTITLEESPA